MSFLKKSDYIIYVIQILYKRKTQKITAQDILNQLAQQGHNIPDDARNSIFFFSDFEIQEKNYSSTVMRPNHKLDQTTIFVRPSDGYICFRDDKVSNKLTIAKLTINWSKDLAGKYMRGTKTSTQIKVKESGYYE